MSTSGGSSGTDTGLRLASTAETNDRGRENAAPSTMPVLSEEERRVMKQCEREGFYRRALPLSLGCMVAAQMLVRSGRWKRHPSLGALPKTMITGGIGYIVGKIMYLPQCQQKILEEIPDSNLAIAVRKSRGLSDAQGDRDSQWTPPESRNTSPKESYQSPSTTPNSPTEGLDDRFRPSVDRDVKAPESDSSSEKAPVTYEELRRRNRQEYDDNLAKRSTRSPSGPSYKESPLMPQRVWPDRGDRSTKQENEDPVEPPQSSVPPGPSRKRTNIWGDVIDD